MGPRRRLRARLAATLLLCVTTTNMIAPITGCGTDAQSLRRPVPRGPRPSHKCCVGSGWCSSQQHTAARSSSTSSQLLLLRQVVEQREGGGKSGGTSKRGVEGGGEGRGAAVNQAGEEWGRTEKEEKTARGAQPKGVSEDQVGLRGHRSGRTLPLLLRCCSSYCCSFCCCCCCCCCCCHHHHRRWCVGGATLKYPDASRCDTSSTRPPQETGQRTHKRPQCTKVLLDCWSLACLLACSLA